MKLNTRTILKFGFFCLSFSMNFYLASISFATLSKYFVCWCNFAYIKTIVVAFIRNSRE